MILFKFILVLTNLAFQTFGDQAGGSSFDRMSYSVMRCFAGIVDMWVCDSTSCHQVVLRIYVG